MSAQCYCHPQHRQPEIARCHQTRLGSNSYRKILDPVQSRIKLLISSIIDQPLFPLIDQRVRLLSERQPLFGKDGCSLSDH